MLEGTRFRPSDCCSLKNEVTSQLQWRSVAGTLNPLIPLQNCSDEKLSVRCSRSVVLYFLSLKQLWQAARSFICPLTSADSLTSSAG